MKLKTEKNAYPIGTLSSDIQILKISTPYRDWNTGGRRTRVDYKTSFSLETMREEINKKHPELLTYPDILDVKEIGKDDFLILIAKDSQGSFYPLIHIYKTSTVNFELVNLNGLGSTRSIFLPSPDEKWTSLKGHHDEQFLIQHSPFKVLNLGVGDLLKMDSANAFTVSNYDENIKRYEQDLVFKVLSLDSGLEKGKLTLPKECFRLPRLLVDQRNYTLGDADDDSITFENASKWWDETISSVEVGKTFKLELKKTHKLKADKKKILSVKPVFSDQDSEIDNVALTSENCLKLNPNGAAESLKEKYPEELSTSAFEACFSNIKNLPADFIKSRCKNKSESTIFKTNKSSILKTSFTYVNPKTKSETKSEGYKLTLNNMEYLYLSEPEGELNLIANVFALSKENALLLTRGTGPWNIFLLTDSLTEGPTLKHVTDFAFLSSSNESPQSTIKAQLGEWLGDKKYVYFANSGFMFLQDGSFFKIKHLLSVDGNFGLSFSEWTEKEFKVNLLDLSKKIDNPYLPTEIFQKEFVFNNNCASKFMGTISEYSFPQGNKWFQSHFLWDKPKGDVKLIKNCHP